MKKSGRNSRPRGRNDSKRVSKSLGFRVFPHLADRQLSSKRRGELAELAFAYKAASKGFHISKPYGDNERYDFVLDNGHRLWRVQVKCTNSMLFDLYHLNTMRRLNGRAVPYRIGEIDFLAAYIFPEDTWFILPVRAIHRRPGLLFAPRGYSPHHSPSRPAKMLFKWQLLEVYREAWPLLRK